MFVCVKFLGFSLISTTMSCPDCLTGDMLPGEPTGAYNIQGAYLAPARGSSHNSGCAILLLTDAFGLPLKNSKILADKFATELKCDVWVPDYFEGMYMRFSFI